MAWKAHQGRAHIQGPQRIFTAIRGRIAEKLQAPDLKVKPASPEELAIGTFAPSVITDGARISDYPFVEARYVSLADGHVYIVYGGTDDGEAVVAYQLGFLQSIFTLKGGEAVAITADGWIDAVMHVYSLKHASFQMINGEVENINGSYTIRRSYPGWKLRAYLRYLNDNLPIWVAAKQALSQARQAIRKKLCAESKAAKVDAKS